MRLEIISEFFSQIEEFVMIYERLLFSTSKVNLKLIKCCSTCYVVQRNASFHFFHFIYSIKTVVEGSLS